MNSNREETLFFAAAEMATPEMRVAYLDRECAGDAALRQRVEALLAKSLQADAFFGEELKSAAEGPAGTVITPITEKAGDTIGRYKLLQQIGEGGCGVVYMAEQSVPVKRRVALKVIKLGMDTKQVVARFEAERQALALMDHPNIAKVLDAGATDAGRPFFVMELVRGTKITEFCDQQKLSTGERLDLFIQVCTAIQHAHQKGIIHRDIKPSNVLVTMIDGKAVPKVIDFGIAKATSGQELTDKTLFTAFEQFIGTPAYMSPEQAEMSGVDIDTRSDIYSLGVLLYELLTGRTPFDAQELLRSGIEGIRKTLKEQEPPKPSTRLNTLADVDLTTVANARHAEPPKLLHAVRGDLDWVVMKCLEKDRARRYETANGLAADLKRHLSNEPIVARPPSVGYLLQKAYRRNRLVVAVAGAVSLALLIGIVASAWQAVRATRAEKAAEAEAQRAVAAEKNARTESERASKAEAVAVQKAAETSKALARSALSLAEAALREGNGPAMQAALQDVPENLREGTWRYLFDQSDSSFATLDFGGGIDDVAAHPRLPHVFAMIDHSGTVTMLNVRTGERLLEFKVAVRVSDGRFYRMALSQDGERIAIGAGLEESGIAVHDARDGRKLFGSESRNTTVLALSSDGRLLLQGGQAHGDKPTHLTLRDTTSGEILWTVRAPGQPQGLVFLADDQQILMQAHKSQPTILSVEDGSLLRKLATDAASAAALSPDGRSVVTLNGESVVRGVDLEGKGGGFEFSAGDQFGRSEWNFLKVAFSGSGVHFVTVIPLGDGRQAIRVWDAKTRAPRQVLLGGMGRVLGAAIHPLSGELIVCGPQTRAWSLDGARWTFRDKGRRSSSVAFWGSDDLLFTTANNVSEMALYPLDGAAPSAIWKSYGNGDHRVAAVSADGQVAAVGWQSSKPVRVLRREGRDVREVGGFEHQYQLDTLRLSPNGDRAAILQAMGLNLQLYETATGERPVQLDRTDLKRFFDLAWLDDRHLLGLAVARENRGSAGAEEQVVVWDTTTGKILRRATNPSAMDVLAVAPDGRRFAEAGADKKVRIRDAATLAVLKEFRAHDGPITALAWHPKQPLLATTSEDLTVRLWNLETGERIEEFRGPLAAPNGLDFSPGGRRLACAALDGTTRIWEPTSLRDETAAPLHTDAKAINEHVWFKAAQPDRPAAPEREKPKPVPATAAPAAPGADGWEDLLAPLTPELVEQTGHGWSLKDGELFGSALKYAALPLPARVSGTSYQMRVKLRQFPANNVFHVVLPVADRMCGFELEGSGKYTGLLRVNGTWGKDVPGVVEGKQINDTEPHDLEITVRLDGTNATITAMLDGKPLYTWTGPTAALSQGKHWATTERGALALGTYAGGWAVSEVKVKRLEAGKK